MIFFFGFHPGDTLQWLRDGFEILNDVADTESQAAQVDEEDEGNICFVPAFNGLYAPYWRKDARGYVGPIFFNPSASVFYFVFSRCKNK